MNSIPVSIPAYTTSYGTQISSRILSDLMESIRQGTDSQRAITDHLRDVIPLHEDDLIEAMEVYNHTEDLLHDHLCEHEKQLEEYDPDFGRS